MQGGEGLRNTRRVGVIGGNSPGLQATQQAHSLGREIARRGYILVNGGMGGVMESSARGARAEGGLVIGILPGTDRDQGNTYSDIVIPTGLGYSRNPLVILNSDIVVAVDGSYGTLSEIAYARIYRKKILGLQTWDIPGVLALDSVEETMKAIQTHFEKEL